MILTASLRILILSCGVLGWTRAATAESPDATLECDPRLETFSRALERAGVADVLDEEPGPFTVFAPTDEAFRRLPEDLREKLFADGNEDALERVLGLHVVLGAAHEADDIPVELRPLSPGRIVVTYTRGALTLRPALSDDAEDASKPRRAAAGGKAASSRATFAPTTASITGSTRSSCPWTSGRSSMARAATPRPCALPARPRDATASDRPASLDRMIAEPPDPMPFRASAAAGGTVEMKTVEPVATEPEHPEAAAAEKTPPTPPASSARPQAQAGAPDPAPAPKARSPDAPAISASPPPSSPPAACSARTCSRSPARFWARSRTCACRSGPDGWRRS